MEFSLSVTVDDGTTTRQVASAMVHAAIIIQNEHLLGEDLAVDEQREVYGVTQALPFVQDVSIFRVA